MIVKRRKNAISARLITADEMVTIDGKQVQAKVGQYVVRDGEDKMLLDADEFEELYEIVGKKMPNVPQAPVMPSTVADRPPGDPQVLPRP